MYAPSNDWIYEMTLSKLSLAAAAAVLSLGACVDTSENNPNRNTQQGALVGAGLGALVGVAAGDNARERRNGAVVGAVIGGGLGALGGSQLDRQEAELRQQMGNNIGIVNNGQQLIVTLPQDILFATDSAQLTGSLQNDLFTLAGSINRYPDTTVNVVGHTDNVGAAAYNQSLSQRRAQAVSSVLINAGVSSNRIRSLGRGEDAPIATNLTPEGRQQNRRVEIIITPN
jgi:outer membrane protein OmpA-like peptidoglycan-associated protein